MENVKYIPGDLVIYQGQICKVGGSVLHSKTVLYKVKDKFVSRKTLKGVPLTTSILKKNGGYRDGDKYVIGILHIGPNQFKDFRFCHELQHLLFAFNLPMDLKL